MVHLKSSTLPRSQLESGNGNTVFSFPLPGQLVESERQKVTRSLSEAKGHNENPKANERQSNG
jgi:hypothetical protein